jgi:hypothetical protein
MNVFENVKGKEKTEKTPKLRCTSNHGQLSKMKHKIPFQDKGITQLFATLRRKDSKLLGPSTVQ